MSSAVVRPRPRTLWEQGVRPARDAVPLGIALLVTAMVLDLMLSEGLGLFYDLVFVTLSVAAALTIRHEDFFAVGVAPPLAMFTVVLLLAVSEPGAIAQAGDGAVQATVSGLSAHALALAGGYGACLALLLVRRQYAERHPR
ncbi:DUF6542 domain-containing protein [Nocardioides sp. Root190]|uniref:DUF6542 domain-containing protein n=1 Tax=Nocardioides sp. Root190 TaxID=1736488 RepID=UPI0012FAC7FF|nr:DUF6542 domain-containing protein [Nocardioides sp. Root190]